MALVIVHNARRKLKAFREIYLTDARTPVAFLPGPIGIMVRLKDRCLNHLAWLKQLNRELHLEILITLSL